jgi:type IV secretory pathway component VirB8
MSYDSVVANAVNQLHKTIKEFSDTATKQTDKMIRLTSQIKCLTYVMIFCIVVQIVIALFIYLSR